MFAFLFKASDGLNCTVLSLSGSFGLLRLTSLHCLLLGYYTTLVLLAVAGLLEVGGGDFIDIGLKTMLYVALRNA